MEFPLIFLMYYIRKTVHGEYKSRLFFFIYMQGTFFQIVVLCVGEEKRNKITIKNDCGIGGENRSKKENQGKKKQK